jgi:hypothetical protein
MYEFVEIKKPDSKGVWLTEEQKVDFESTYFDDEECALDFLIEITTQNGLDKDFIEMFDNGRGRLPFELNEVDHNPMIEATASWNEYKTNNWK